MPIPALPLFRHRDTVVTPADQNQFVTQFETTMDTMSNDVIPALNLAITDINGKVITATTARDEAVSARNIAVAAKDEALTAVATLQEGAIDDTIIAPNKAFSNQYIENNYYDKTETYSKTEVDTAINDATLDINALSDKPTPINTDNFVLQEVGGVLKKVSYANLIKLPPNDTNVKTALNASGTAPIYACRAWAKIGTTDNIQASGNISSFVRGSSNVTFNMTIAQIDNKYAYIAQSNQSSGASHGYEQASPPTTNSFSFNNNSNYSNMSVSVFR